MPKDEIRRHFDSLADEYDAWKEKSSYYYELLAGIYREFVPAGASVLEIGCGTGTLLASLAPRRGVGIDFSARMVAIAAARHPHLTFIAADAERLDLHETFDFIIVPDVIEHLTDVPAMLRSARRCCGPGSRVIVTCANPLWAPVLDLAERMKLKMPEGEHRWLPSETVTRMAAEAGFDTAAIVGRILFPKRIPGLSALLNFVARLPLLRPFCLVQAIVLVPRPAGEPAVPKDCGLRREHELAHGRMLARDDPEALWGWKTPAGRERARRRAELIAHGGRLGPGTRVLEIGCGTGMFTEMFAGAGATIVAVDISPDLLKMTRARGLPPGRVRFLAKRFEECEVEGPFDAVVGSSILHHVEIAESLAKIRALLKPGGAMSFAEPNYLNPQVFIERKFTFLRPWLRHVSPDESAFVRWRLRGLLLAAGFADVEIVPFDWLHPATPKALIPLVGRAGRLLETIPLVREFAGSLLIRARRPL